MPPPDAADQATARGHDVGALHGLPITVKDSLETAGLRTTSGAPTWPATSPPGDADAVARLRAAGAVIFGKTNLPIFAMDWQTSQPGLRHHQQPLGPRPARRAARPAARPPPSPRV